MELSATTFWWVAAGVAVAAELATGTFYLLMMALGLAAAAVAAHVGASATQQIATAAVAGGGATSAWHWLRSRRPPPPPPREDRDVNLDIGERVRVDAWSPERTARVTHRGTLWTARLEPGAPAGAGEHVVVAVEGNWLVVAPAPER